MEQIKFLMFVARLQMFADMVFDGSIKEIILELEEKRRRGEIPLVGTEAYDDFVAFLRELQALRPKLDRIAKAGNDFAKMVRAGSSGMN